jgi:hypothetical protein
MPELSTASDEAAPRVERDDSWDMNPREERQRSRMGDDNDEGRSSRQSREDNDRYDEPRPSRRSRERDDYDDEPRYSRRSRERSRDDFDRPGYRRRKSSGNSLMVGLVIVGVVAVIGIFAAISYGLFGSGRVIPESEWKPFEEPNRYKVLMPGSPKRSIQQEPGGLPMTAQMVEYDRNTVFLVGHSEGVIPPERLRLPTETLLNDACDGAMKGIGDEGGVEKSRESIQLGEIPGKQLIIEIKKGRVRGIARVYLTNNRLYMLIAAGKGYTPEHENVKRFFNSFEIIETGHLPHGVVPRKVVNDWPPPPNVQIQPKKKIDPAREARFKQKIDPFQPPQIEPKTIPQNEASDPSILGPKDADAKLVQAKVGDIVYLNDMSEFGWKTSQSYSAFGKNGQQGFGFRPKDKTIVNGMNSPKTLSTHAGPTGYTRICYALGRRASTLQGSVAFSEDDPGIGGPFPTRWVIMGDGKMLWRSDSIGKFGVVQDFKIDIGNVDILELRVYAETGNSHNCHAVWIDPRVVVRDAINGKDPIKDAPIKGKEPIKDPPMKGKEPIEGPTFESKLFTRPAKSAVSTSYLKFESSRGDYIGQGRKYDYRGDQFVSRAIPRGVSISVDGWHLEIGAPKNETLKIGEYADAKRFVFSGNSPGLNLSGNGRGANMISGEFVVWELEMQDGKIVKLAIDFTQRCDGGAPLRGKLRINSGFE